jgi:hypothetical protein
LKRRPRRLQSFWCYQWEDGEGSILVLLTEWKWGRRSGLHFEGMWLYEDDCARPGVVDSPEIEHLRDAFRHDATLAELAHDGRLVRLGSAPPRT